MRPINARAGPAVAIRANSFKPTLNTKNVITRFLAAVPFGSPRKKNVTAPEKVLTAALVIDRAFAVRNASIVVSVHISIPVRALVALRIVHVTKPANALAVHAVNVLAFAATSLMSASKRLSTAIATKSRNPIIPVRVMPGAITAVHVANSLGITRSAKRAFVIINARLVKPLVNTVVLARTGTAQHVPAGR